MNTEAEARCNNGSIYIGEESKIYGTKYKINSDKELECLSKKQIKVLYPKKDYKIVAEYAAGNSRSSAGILEYKNSKLNLSENKSHNRAVYSEKGFVSVGEDSFVVLLKNTLAVRTIIAALCIAFITAGAILAVDLIGQKNIVAIDDEQIAAGGVEEAVLPELEEGAVDWEGVKPANTGGLTAGIAIPGYKSISIEAGATDVKVNLQNPEGNPCYFVISLLLDDGTVLYQSKMIEPGKGLYEIELTKSLDAGEYPATVKYETYSLDSLNPLNGAEVKITLIAE